MIKNILLAVVLFATTNTLFSQEKEIKIEEERVANRLMLYAINENLVDLDVMLEVEGTGFRQSKSKPRMVRVPATSKVHMLNLMVNKKQQPVYTAKITANDSLSRRALRKPFDLVKIDPKKPLTVYLTRNCVTCDTIVASLNASPYRYTLHDLVEKPEIEKQLAGSFVGTGTTIEELTNPVFSIQGSIYGNISDYDTLLEKLNE